MKKSLYFVVLSGVVTAGGQLVLSKPIDRSKRFRCVQLSGSVRGEDSDQVKLTPSIGDLALSDGPMSFKAVVGDATNPYPLPENFVVNGGDILKTTLKNDGDQSATVELVFGGYYETN